MSDTKTPEEEVVSWLWLRDGLRISAKVFLILAAAYLAVTSNKLLDVSLVARDSYEETVLFITAVVGTGVSGLLLLALEPNVLWSLLSANQRQKRSIDALQKERREALVNLECIGKLGDLAKLARRTSPLVANSSVDEFRKLFDELLGPMEDDLPTYYSLEDRPQKYSISIYIVSSDGERLHCVFRCRNFDLKTASRTWSISEDYEFSHVVQCFRSNAPLHSGNLYDNIEHEKILQKDRERYRSVACFPIVAGNSSGPSGVYCVTSSKSNHFVEPSLSGYNAISEIIIGLLTKIIASRKISS